MIRNSGEKNLQAGRMQLSAGTDRKKSKTEGAGKTGKKSLDWKATQSGKQRGRTRPRCDDP
ncbi:hypothetical protein [Candidatus Nitrotoga fabula]|uniref:hypothetical protein n=1 Tax=Candidatus Nitrotoga fabula TaxID=2182327 RepID=UPI001BB47DA4|nr:hypothetical protein [Candidatus Nitrotoga fabula]